MRFLHHAMARIDASGQGALACIPCDLTLAGLGEHGLSGEIVYR